MTVKHFLFFLALVLIYEIGIAQVGISVNGGFAKSQGRAMRLSSGLGLNLEKRLGDKVRFVVIPTLNSRGYNGNGGISTVKVNYLDVPVQLQFDLAESSKPVYLGLGGYYGFALSGKYKSNLTGSDIAEWQKMKFGEDINSTRSKTDYGIVIDIGGRFPTYNGYYKAGFQSLIGLKNVVPQDRKNAESVTDKEHIRLMKYSFYVTYCFGDDD